MVIFSVGFKLTARLFFILPAFSCLLTSCSVKDSRYKSTEMLERPPRLVLNSTVESEQVADDSVVPKKKHRKGLKEEVALEMKAQPPMIKIKQPFAEAWNTVELALKQREIKITDQERDKGWYYVDYNPPSLLGAVSGWLR